MASGIDTGISSTLEKGGVFGWATVARGLAKLGAGMGLKAHTFDAAALAAMVAIAKSRVPVDTGLLLNGITGTFYERWATFSSSPVHVDLKNYAYYARFVEFGTAPGQRGIANALVAGEGFYSGDTASANPLRGKRVVKNRKAKRTHPGTKAQPFFFNSANEVLKAREGKMRDVIPQAAADAGWEMA